MTDVHSKKTRSYNMSQIKSKNTKPEELVRKFLFSKGLRYRKNDKRYPGHPDIVLPKYNTIVFVHGCFWHYHGCEFVSIPSTNTEFWKKKFTKNKERDVRVQKELKEMGWRVIVIWECQLRKDNREQSLKELYEKIVGLGEMKDSQ